MSSKEGKLAFMWVEDENSCSATDTGKTKYYWRCFGFGCEFPFLEVETTDTKDDSMTIFVCHH